MLSLTKKNVGKQQYVRLVDTLAELWMRCGQEKTGRRASTGLEKKEERRSRNSFKNSSLLRTEM